MPMYDDVDSLRDTRWKHVFEIAKSEKQEGYVYMVSQSFSSFYTALIISNGKLTFLRIPRFTAKIKQFRLNKIKGEIKELKQMTQKLKKEIIVPKDRAEFYKKHANLTGEQSVQEGALRDTDRDFCYIEEVTFDNGYRAVIELIIGEDDNPNWAEGILFNPDNYEVSSCAGKDGDIFGEWFFWTGEPDVEYTVIVKEGV
jgi:hypothetical protein